MHVHPEKIFFFNMRTDGFDRYFQQPDQHRAASHMHLWTDTGYHVLDTPDYHCRADGIEIMQRRIVTPDSDRVATLDKLYKFDQKNPWQTQGASLTTMTDMRRDIAVGNKGYFDIDLQFITPMTVTRYDVSFDDTLIQATQWHAPALDKDMALLTLNPVMAVSGAYGQTAQASNGPRAHRLSHLYELIDDMLGRDMLEPMDDMPMQQIAKGMCVFRMP